MPQLKNFPNVRVADLIAKTAGVSLLDTVRVLAAMRCVSEAFVLDPVQVLVEEHAVDRPDSTEVLACAQADEALSKYFRDSGRTPELKAIRRLGR